MTDAQWYIDAIHEFIPHLPPVCTITVLDVEAFIARQDASVARLRDELDEARATARSREDVISAGLRDYRTTVDARRSEIQRLRGRLLVNGECPDCGNGLKMTGKDEGWCSVCLRAPDVEDDA